MATVELVSSNSMLSNNCQTPTDSIEIRECLYNQLSINNGRCHTWKYSLPQSSIEKYLEELMLLLSCASNTNSMYKLAIILLGTSAHLYQCQAVPVLLTKQSPHQQPSYKSICPSLADEAFLLSNKH